MMEMLLFIPYLVVFQPYFGWKNEGQGRPKIMNNWTGWLFVPIWLSGDNPLNFHQNGNCQWGFVCVLKSHQIDHPDLKPHLIQL